MLGTIAMVHGKAGWLFTNKDGGWEYPAFWTVGLLALALLGTEPRRSDDARSLNAIGRRFNSLRYLLRASRATFLSALTG